MAKEFTDENFEKEVLNSEVPVLVDFWGEGCGPCVAMTPVLEELASEYKKTIKIGKVDVYANPSISSRYGIRSIPSFLFFKDGEVQETVIGARPKSFMKDKLDSVI